MRAVIPKAEQPDFRAHAPRVARKSGALASDEESRRQNGGNLASFEGVIASETNRPT